jgi:hypothetical protein
LIPPGVLPLGAMGAAAWAPLVPRSQPWPEDWLARKNVVEVGVPLDLAAVDFSRRAEVLTLDLWTGTAAVPGWARGLADTGGHWPVVTLGADQTPVDYAGSGSI